MENFSEVLELNKILEMTASLATCEEAAERIRHITPCPDYYDAKLELDKTSDANTLTNRYGTPSLGGMKNCTSQIRRAALGSTLNTRELLDVAYILRTIRNLANWKRQCEGETSLDFLFGSLVPQNELETDINNCIISEDEISDKASSELAKIRRSIKNAESAIRSQLDNLIRSSTYQKYLQEQLITIRDGRFVVPVKAEYKNDFSGLVHDVSSSGATYFIEPMSVVKLNNEIKILRSGEQSEIERILSDLSAKVGSCADSIISGYEIAVELDIYFSKSRLADKMKANVPVLTDDGSVVLKSARHPLIATDKCVPIDISIGDQWDTLVITGPNTGGKTVALKTLGLLTIMASCGFMLPCSSLSRVSVFEKVLADIGDSQSIQSSLSTFSSHLTNIVSIINKADPHSLVLLDELGAGTDPVEGAALAISIIEQLRIQGARIAATTHYAEMKLYALNTEGVENASCEFDISTLRPTYRLLTGIPGHSNAFAISERLGISPEVIDRARRHMESDSIRLEEVMSQLDEMRMEMERSRDDINARRKEADELAAQAERKLTEAQKQAENNIENARRESLKIIESAELKAEELIDSLEEVIKQKNSENFAEMAALAKQNVKQNFRKLHELSDPVSGKYPQNITHNRKLKRGDIVELVELGSQGIVTSDPDGAGNVTVQTGIIKTKINVSKLRLLDQAHHKASFNGRPAGQGITSNAVRSVNTDVDLRGMASDEAILVLDREIDNAVLSGLNQITIIHGKGTGILRSAVHNHLRSHKSVKSFRLGRYGEGENGVTIAELK